MKRNRNWHINRREKWHAINNITINPKEGNYKNNNRTNIKILDLDPNMSIIELSASELNNSIKGHIFGLGKNQN